MQDGFHSTGALKVPSPSDAAFRKGWVVPPGGAGNPRWIFVFNFSNKATGLQMQEVAIAGLHLKPCSSEGSVTGPVAMPDGKTVCFVGSTASAGGSFVTFSDLDFAYQFNATGSTENEQRDLLLGVVGRLQPRPSRR
jgi:hypothetical protein